MNNIETLTPEYWLEEGYVVKGGKDNDNGIWMTYHYKGTFLWAPDHSVVNLMLRKLGESMHKHPISLHVFICPKLTMPVWGRPLFNMAEFVVYDPPGAKFCPSSMHKLFVLGFIYPLISHRPWWIRVTAKVLGLVRAVSLLIQESPGDAGIVLLQLWLLPKRVDSMPGELVRELILS